MPGAESASSWQPLPAWLAAAVAFGYLFLLFAVAYRADRQARLGRSWIDAGWVYALSIAVYCTAWTYFGSVGRAASGGLWFLPIYLGPTLVMLLAAVVVRRMVRVAKQWRITSVSDFIATRYGRAAGLGRFVSLFVFVGVVPYVALQLKAISFAFDVLTGVPVVPVPGWWADRSLWVAAVLIVFAALFGTRHLDVTERHEGLVAAIAFESVVKLGAFLLLGAWVTFIVFSGPAAIVEAAQARFGTAVPPIDAVDGLNYGDWAVMIVLAGLAFLLLPRQFQVMVVENVREGHVERAAWQFPAYLVLINLFVLPVALAGRLFFGDSRLDPDTYVLALPLAQGQLLLALLVFVGGISAATSMVIVESVAVATMICNDWVAPWWVRRRQVAALGHAEIAGTLLWVRRVVIAAVLACGYGYYRLTGESFALVSIGLISFAAVAQLAPAALGGLFWAGGSRMGAAAGIVTGMLVWSYSLMLPSLAKSGWFEAHWVEAGPWGIAWLQPERLFGVQGMAPLTASVVWSLGLNTLVYVLVSLIFSPRGEQAQWARRFVRVDAAAGSGGAWRGRVDAAAVAEVMARFLGEARTRELLVGYARGRGLASLEALEVDAAFVRFAETMLAGAIGGAAARLVLETLLEESSPSFDDVMHVLDEANQIRTYSRMLEEKSRALEEATRRLQEANEKLTELDRLKDEFISAVTHELRTPLTSIRALAEILAEDPDLPRDDRLRFYRIIVRECERLTRLVNQVLDLAKLESGHGQWHPEALEVGHLLQEAIEAILPLATEKGVRLEVSVAPGLPPVWADRDRVVQVILNLLNNALKFVPEGAGIIEIQADRQGEGEVAVHIADNGPGISPEFLPHVFERFRQATQGAAKPPGTGLGLAICKRIVEHMGGRIWVESTPGKGARFTFTLPLAVGAAHKDGGRHDDEEDPGGR
ncbi:ATP-binding protein [Tepidiphilus sp. HLB4]|jgi:signal transduction histidine kinase